MTPDEIARAARQHFLNWLEWYKDGFPEESGGSYEQLAPKIGVTPPAISAWRKKGSTRYPSLPNLVRFYALVRKAWDGARIDDLLTRDPPSRPRR